MSRRILVAVDGGGSKTDAVALDPSGTLLARARDGATSPHLVGLRESVRVVDSLVRTVVDAAGGGTPWRTHVYLSGLDLPVELEDYRDAAAGFDWGSGEDRLTADNDLFALLRAGTDAPEAVAVVCGTGINCVGVRADGASTRFPALGEISGDWGGGFGLGRAALWHAARAEDGRGPATVLRALVPQALGLGSVREVTEALHFGRIPEARIAALCPALFDAAEDGDAVAGTLVERQAEEIVTMTRAALDRLGLREAPLPVVLGGGIAAADRPLLLDAVRRRLGEVAPRARLEVVHAPPILGAALLALESAEAAPSALAAARRTLDHRGRPRGAPAALA